MGGGAECMTGDGDMSPAERPLDWMPRSAFKDALEFWVSVCNTFDEGRAEEEEELLSRE